MSCPKSLNHTVWECKYHLIWIPKYRKKVIYGNIRKYLGEIFHELASHRESEIVEGHLKGDHVHILISIPPKYAVSQVVGYMKGKSAIYISREFGGKKRNFTGQKFWARGYYASTVDQDEESIRAYIKKHEQADKRIEQLGLFD